MAKSYVSYQRTITITTQHNKLQVSMLFRMMNDRFFPTRQSPLPSAIVQLTCTITSRLTRADMHAGFIQGRILFQSTKTSMWVLFEGGY